MAYYLPALALCGAVGGFVLYRRYATRSRPDSSQSAADDDFDSRHYDVCDGIGDCAELNSEETSESVRRRRSPLGDGPGLILSEFAMQGRRKTMEDAHYVRSDPKGTVIGVWDGAAGPRGAALGRFLLTEATFRALRDAPAASAEPVLRDFLAASERDILAAAKRGKWNDASTVVLARIGAETLDCGWVGDSRCVVGLRRASSAGRPAGVEGVALTRDHNAAEAAEAARIRKRGGHVGRNEREARAGTAARLFARVAPASLVHGVKSTNPPRVYPGGITLTRCLGGLSLKRAARQLVTADAEFSRRELDGTEAFCIVACDGVWCVFDEQQACEIVHHCGDASQAARALCEAAHEKGSGDNISAVVVSWPS
ncbi:phosphatase 2C-like domain-containing protein [Pelagophyceae sp. CCMP2097]|nr:phosphatase 2C-like domain-containing protein [Pelagophyceae sp. CCMP2097]